MSRGTRNVLHQMLQGTAEGSRRWTARERVTAGEQQWKALGSSFWKLSAQNPTCSPANRHVQDPLLPHYDPGPRCLKWDRAAASRRARRAARLSCRRRVSSTTASACGRRRCLLVQLCCGAATTSATCVRADSLRIEEVSDCCVWSGSVHGPSSAAVRGKQLMGGDVTGIPLQCELTLPQQSVRSHTRPGPDPPPAPHHRRLWPTLSSVACCIPAHPWQPYG